ncbi:cutinase [Crucibulum laeve]|uniref:cutinase n=1 Tax=Crucibulum laeve TaxID=68775 RepID=A0A5C3LT72_9AGAR|nr:cutinase [Crucibulum laeve]
MAMPITEPAPRQACADVYVFFARGTTELGTLGMVVDPPFQTALQALLGEKSVVFEGIDYPAQVTGFLTGGDAGGSITMAKRVTSISERCLSSKIVMSGYSQGAQVTHNAANRLSAAIQNRVNAVITFGDPFQRRNLPGVLQNRRDTFCNVGDLICTSFSVILAPHLAYGSDAGAAASFVVECV